MAKKASITEIVEWVAENYELVVERDGPKVLIQWENADSPPPSNLARSYLKQAANNPAWFFEKIVPKFLGDGDIVSEEDLAHDKKLVSQIRQVLKNLTEGVKKPPKRGKKDGQGSKEEAKEEEGDT